MWDVKNTEETDLDDLDNGFIWTMWDVKLIGPVFFFMKDDVLSELCGM